MQINTDPRNRLRYTAFAPLYDWMTRFCPQRKWSMELLALTPGERVLIAGARMARICRSEGVVPRDLFRRRQCWADRP